ncbi:MAG TPA: hemerythrin domain-containing protein [Acidimicrobiia bacterium]
MCEHCGCRENPEIGQLGAEHDAIVELADQVLSEVAAGSETVAGAAARLLALLIPHVRREEAGVFRVADEIGLRNQYVEDLEEDHRRFDGSLSDPGRMSPRELESLLDDIYRHIAIEEYDLFPVVARELNARLAVVSRV